MGERGKRKFGLSRPIIKFYRLSGMLTGFLELGFMVDVQLRGEDGGSVPAHQLILTHVSPLLNTILRYLEA